MFNTTACTPCPARLVCTHSKRRRGTLTIRPHHEQTVRRVARAYQQTDDFWARYPVRAGSEGTMSQAVVALDMRRSRYRGAAKTHVQHVATAAACTSKRIVNWWHDVPVAATRSSRFACLMAT